MAKFKNGDKVKLKQGVNRGGVCGTFNGYDTLSYLIIDKAHAWDDGTYPYSYTGYNQDGQKLTSCSCCYKDEHLEFFNSNKNSIMTDVKQAFNQLFLKEPQKSFQKAGVTDGSNQLTSDGRDIFLAWLLEKHGDDFKKEVVDPILKSQEDEK